MRRYHVSAGSETEVVRTETWTFQRDNPDSNAPSKLPWISRIRRRSRSTNAELNTYKLAPSSSDVVRSDLETSESAELPGSARPAIPVDADPSRVSEDNSCPLIARKYDGSAQRGSGRPAIAKEIRALTVQMASENESWGYTRIVGELSKLGHRVSRSTVRRILKEHGIGPAPERVLHMPWSKFLKAHWEVLAAADFFTVEVWTKIGLVRYLVFFVIDLPTRRVEIAGIAPVANGLWMHQVGRT